MLYEIHMIKNYPPTNLNRDDTGAPKSCLFGGVQRGRISSQCQKRAWRRSTLFADSALGGLGIRTRKLPDLVCKRLCEMGIDESYMEEAKKKISGYGNKDGKENEKGITAQIVFYSPEDIEEVAKIVAQSIKECGSVKEFIKLKPTEWQKKTKDVELRPITLDIALFGRMVTSDAFENVEAAMQVAHAISTHKMSMESDYFTAVDDLVKGGSDEDSGAGMIGDIEYNSCCYYLYASIDTDQLRANLRNSPDPEAMIQAAIPALIETMAYTDPSGKQNTFAGHVLPEVVAIELKKRKVPVNYVNAFVDPARASFNCSLTAESVRKLAAEMDAVDKKYGLDIDERLWFSLRDASKPANAKECVRFKDMLEYVAESARDV